MAALTGTSVTSTAGTLTAVASTTSGVSTFNLEIVELIEEAYEQAGTELRSGYDIKTARRSLNLLALDWANRGYNLWTVEQGSISLVPGTASYSLPADTIDIVEMVIRTAAGSANTDISVSRIGMPTYATIPNKQTRGRPVQVWVDRQISPRVVVWPVPDSTTTYTLVYWRMRRMQDAGATGSLTFDIPERFLPCLIAGLAYKIALKRPELMGRLQMLKDAYEEQWLMASTEDREKVPVRFVPARMCI
jgi:hypothetical protein